MHRSGIRFASLALLLSASTAFAQSAPTSPPPPTPPPLPQPADSAPPAPPVDPHAGPMHHHRDDDARRDERRHDDVRREDDHHGDAQHGEGARTEVPVRIDSGAKNAIVERKVTTQESFGHVAIALPMHLSTDTWEQVCVAPCSVSLPRASSYRIAVGNGMPGTHSFTLAPNKPEVDLRIKPGNLGAFGAGATLTGLGIGAAITGAVLLSVAGKFHDESDVRVAGAITGGAGLVLMAVGIPLMIVNQTKVYADGQRVAARPRKPVQLGVNGLQF